MYQNIIVIPYRNRERHLDYFIKNSVPLFQEHLPNTKVIVVEQNEGKLFNRGALLNIGFKEYENKTKYFFTHDVDLNPTEKYIKEYYVKDFDEDSVLGIYTAECDTLGGIIKIHNSVIHRINGFPNNIWGWGNEDKALQNRSEYFNINKITSLTNKKEHPEYLLRFDDVKDRNRKYQLRNEIIHYRMFNKLSNHEKEKLIMETGLNNLEYTKLERKQLHDMLELIKVDI